MAKVESSARRAFRDTIASQKTARFMWGGEGVFAVGGGAWLATIAPVTASGAEVVGGAVAGGLIGLSVAFLVILFWNLLTAPYRQRNEAWANVATLVEEKSELDKRLAGTDRTEFAILWSSENAYYVRRRGEALYRNHDRAQIQDPDASTLGVDCDVVFKPMRGRITVDDLWLDFAGHIGKLADAWPAETFVEETKRNLMFDIPAGVARGERTARLMAIVDGRETDCDKVTLDLPLEK